MATVPTQTLVAWCDDALNAGAYTDHGPNGLQVPGPAQVATVASGVSACAALFDAAADVGADLVLVHHGLFWGSGPAGLDAVTAARLKLLFTHDLALVQYHLPLDGDPVLGNNALLAAALEVERTVAAFEHGGMPIGLVATLPGDGLAVDDLLARVTQAVGGRMPLLLAGGPDRVGTLGIVSGAAADDVTRAAALGCDALLTGEVSERTTALARELGVHVIGAGHHATERFGVRALGDRLAQEFGLQHVFLDVENPV